MGQVITHSKRKLTKNFRWPLILSMGLLLTSCTSGCLDNANSDSAALVFPSGETLALELARTPQEQTRGLSDRKKTDFPKDRGMLFVYHRDEFRQFWMPDTYFDLAIAFLDKDFKVLAVENPVPHHPSRQEPIPRTGSYFSRYVLEVRSDSPFAEKLSPGIQLKWKGPKSYLEK